jgi:hypothetical protein
VRLAVALAVLKSCSSGLDDVGPPPDDSLAYVDVSLHKACYSFEDAADDIATGIDTVDASLMTRASAEMSEASDSVNDATEAVREYTSEHGG